ncbi:hypothetical protein [Enhygromyxa salina]|nr:hypothetical protein [Enhygromyxa salina]
MALTGGVACVEDQDFVIVDRAIWFSAPDSCTLTGSEDTPLAMTVDVLYDTRIGMAFLVSNEQVQNNNSNTGIDDSEIVMETAEVSLSFSGGGVSTSAFEVTIPTNSIPGGTSQTFLIQVPADISASLRSTMQGLPAGSFETLEMEVVFKGRRTGQVGKSKLGEVKTRPYVYPFEICLGCLGICLPANDCGGAAEDPPVCASEAAWAGTCGFAQGSAVYNPLCTAPS